MAYRRDNLAYRMSAEQIREPQRLPQPQIEVTRRERRLETREIGEGRKKRLSAQARVRLVYSVVLIFTFAAGMGIMVAGNMALSGVTAEAYELRTDIAALDKEYADMQVGLEKKMTTDELRKAAEQQLGMSAVKASSVEYVDAYLPDSVVVIPQEDGNFLTGVKNSIEAVLDLFS